MNKIRRKVAGSLDWISIAAGCSVWLLVFISPELRFLRLLTILLGVVGLAYFGYAVSLIIKRPSFDWHLIHGNFLRKVICLVVLMPFVLSCLLPGYLKTEELAYEDTLYKSYVNETSLEKEQVDPPLIWGIYYHFMDAGNQHMTTTKSGRGWAALISILGVFLLNGLLVSSIVGWVDSRKERWLKGEVRYKNFLKRKKHYIIIGGNDMVPGVVSEIFKSAVDEYVLIQTSRDVESFRRELFSNLSEGEQKKVIIYYGNRNSKEDIEALILETAEEVYVLGEEARTDDLESYHDTMNMKCLRMISDAISSVSKFMKDSSGDHRLVCRVLFEYQTSFNLFQVTDIDGDKIRFLPFNYYEMWAQKVLICQHLTKDKSAYEYLPLEGVEGIRSEDDQYVHLVIVGMSRMGIAMALEAAHLAHYPNYETKKKRTKITFIDKNADEEKDFFMGRFKALFSLSHWRYGTVADDDLVWMHEHAISCQPHLGGDFVDVEWEFIKGSIEEHAIQRYLIDLSSDDDVKLTIAVCLPENSRAIAAAAYLPDRIYQSDNTLQVLVYQRLNDELVTQLSMNNKRYLKKIRSFGMAKECFNSNLIDISESISKAVGKAYDDFAWGKVVERYLDKGLSSSDMDNFTNGAYSKYPDKRDAIKAICDDWMNKHSKETDSAKVDADRKSILAEVKKISPDNVQKENAHLTYKAKSARMWSNTYNIYSMWTKFRCITTSDGHMFDPLVDSLDELGSDMMNELGKMEHNRWVVEQMLLRYRPLTREEQKLAAVEDMYASSYQKNIYKKELYAHLDICSNDRLDKIDFKMSELDQALISVLPAAYKSYLSR